MRNGTKRSVKPRVPDPARSNVTDGRSRWQKAVSNSSSKAPHSVWQPPWPTSGGYRTCSSSITRSKATRSTCYEKRGIWCGQRYKGCSRLNSNNKVLNNSRTLSTHQPRQYRELSQRVPVARRPTTHRLLPRLQKGLYSPFAVARGLPLGRFLAAQLLPYGAGEREQVAISSGIGVQLCQEQPPHAPILEGRVPTVVSCFSH